MLTVIRQKTYLLGLKMLILIRINIYAVEIIVALRSVSMATATEYVDLCDEGACQKTLVEERLSIGILLVCRRIAA